MCIIHSLRDFEDILEIKHTTVQYFYVSLGKYKLMVWNREGQGGKDFPSIQCVLGMFILNLYFMPAKGATYLFIHSLRWHGYIQGHVTIKRTISESCLNSRAFSTR